MFYISSDNKTRPNAEIVASRLTIEDIVQCWFTPHFSISEEDRTAVTSLSSAPYLKLRAISLETYHSASVFLIASLQQRNLTNRFVRRSLGPSVRPSVGP